MKMPNPLIEGRLLKRYKRFLADVKLCDGTVVTAHTPNTGSMQQCASPGARVLLSQSDNPNRKLAWSWELVEVNGSWVDINTHRANRVVEDGLKNGAIAEFQGYSLRPEYPFADSRIDFMLENQQERVLLEVKNVTLCCDAETACFPDAVTTRGHKHLRDLTIAVQKGWRAVIFFLVQRGEAQAFQPADEIDPEYGRLLREANTQGVEILAYRTRVTAEENNIEKSLKILL